MLFRLIFMTAMLVAGGAKAACTLGEQAEKSGRINIAYMQYIYCAEEENDPQAQYRLGAMFYKGIGLPRPDFQRAVAFFARAANNGYAPAQTKLGLLYWRGEGVTKDLVMAHKWLYLAQEPADMRWFYVVAASQDRLAPSLYAKLNAAIKTAYPDLPDSLPFSSTVNLGGDVLPSYKEVAEFQHENLKQAGEEMLDDRSQADLNRFLNGLLPEIAPRFPAGVGDAEQARARQMILDWFKPVLLTTRNLVPAKVPVLEKLKNEIERPVD